MDFEYIKHADIEEANEVRKRMQSKENSKDPYVNDLCRAKSNFELNANTSFKSQSTII